MQRKKKHKKHPEQTRKRHSQAIAGLVLFVLKPLLKYPVGEFLILPRLQIHFVPVAEGGMEVGIEDWSGWNFTWNIILGGILIHGILYLLLYSVLVSVPSFKFLWNSTSIIPVKSKFP